MHGPMRPHAPALGVRAAKVEVPAVPTRRAPRPQAATRSRGRRTCGRGRNGASPSRRVTVVHASPPQVEARSRSSPTGSRRTSSSSAPRFAGAYRASSRVTSHAGLLAPASPNNRARCFGLHHAVSSSAPVSNRERAAPRLGGGRATAPRIARWERDCVEAVLRHADARGDQRRLCHRYSERTRAEAGT